MRDNQAARAPHGFEHRGLVPGLHRTQVHDLGLDALGGERLGRGRGRIVAARFAVDGRDLAQHRYREQVRRDQEGIEARIVRRAEHRMDQADLLRRPAIAAEHQTVRRLERGALEFIWSGPVLALLFAEGRDRELHRTRPCVVERCLVLRARPIFVAEAHRVAERVDFPFPLGDAGLHLGLVGVRPFELRRRVRVLVEGVGIGVDQDAARLPLDQPLEQSLELRVLRDEMDIGLHLRRTVAQPHRLDIAGDDEGVGAAVERARLDRRVERVRIAIFEQPGEFGVGDLRLHARDLGLDRGAGEGAFAGRGALAREAAGRGARGDGHRGGERQCAGAGHDLAAIGGHVHLRIQLEGALIEKGASAGAVPHCLFGCAPITKSTVPPCDSARWVK